SLSPLSPRGRGVGGEGVKRETVSKAPSPPSPPPPRGEGRRARNYPGALTADQRSSFFPPPARRRRGARTGGKRMAVLIFTRTAGPALVFDLHGALDNAGAEKLEPRVAEALDAGHKLLIFDLSRLSYISSAGLSVFLAAYRRLQGTGSVRFAG